MYNRIKKSLLFIIATAISVITLLPQMALAVPAKPGVITVKQADGSTLNILVKGDEHFNWRTTESGYPITMKSDGFYYYASYSAEGTIQPTMQRVSINGKMQSAPIASISSAQNIGNIAQSAGAKKAAIKRSAMQKSSASGFPSTGKVKSAVILVEYSDLEFVTNDPKQAFYNQLNKEGYNVSGANGSARDYYYTNSKGKFEGEFDVYGPYKLSNTQSYYGANKDNGDDMRASKMIWDAVKMADADGVDFSQYDYDNNGYIDNVFVYYAGHNEAEGASTDSIWPHKWAVYDQPEFDGKKLLVYACTSELRGAQGNTIAGVGTFCHEFGHVFGLADHYDTNDDTNGLCYGLGWYDIMCNGSYNNDGNTPPLLNGLELEMIGWNTPIVLDKSQNITIEPIAEGEVYKILTDVAGEYFLIENRHKLANEWDYHIAASGLFITHVDRSTKYLERWSYYNTPNAYASHECFRYVVAGNTKLSMYSEDKVPYPNGNNNSWTSTSSPAAKSWSGNRIGTSITDITRNIAFSGDRSISMKVNCLAKVKGKVTNIGGDPIADATLNIYSKTSDESFEIITNSNGEFAAEMNDGEYDVEIDCDLYNQYFQTIKVDEENRIFNFELMSYADSIEDIELDVKQTQVTATWNPQEFSFFKVTLISSKGSEKNITTENCKHTFSGLAAECDYSIKVSAKNDDGSYEELYSQTFTTAAQLTETPLINITSYEHNEGDILELESLNTKGTDRTKWYINDLEIKTSKITLTKGRHTIKAVVDRSGKTYKVHRVINVL